MRGSRKNDLFPQGSQLQCMNSRGPSGLCGRPCKVSTFSIHLILSLNNVDFRIHREVSTVCIRKQCSGFYVSKWRIIQSLPLCVPLSSSARTPSDLKSRLCTVWSNFEIADMDFWRGPAYTEFFNYLDATGGFYYEVRGHPVISHTHVPHICCPRSSAMG